MKVSEQNILDLELSINTLIEQKGELSFQKKELEIKNSSLKNQIRTGGYMPDALYKSICDQQNRAKKDVLSVERAISELAIEIRNKSTLKDQLKIQLRQQNGVNIKESLTDLRDYYINFASDKSRVSSMRAMGAEFAEKLEVLIKEL